MSAVVRRAVVRRLAALVAVGVLAGCGISADSSPRDIPEAERELAVVGAAGTAAAGAERIYLVGPGVDRQLRAVSRDASTRRDLIETLLLGPNDEEVAAAYSSLIPPGTELLSSPVVRGQLLTIDLGPEFVAPEVSAEALATAVAQIVYTAAEIDGISTVRITIDGTERTWATPNGDAKSDLRVYDFPGLVESAQPAYPGTPAIPTS